jgi:hypothetical protein
MNKIKVEMEELCTSSFGGMHMEKTDYCRNRKTWLNSNLKMAIRKKYFS